MNTRILLAGVAATTAVMTANAAQVTDVDAGIMGLTVPLGNDLAPITDTGAAVYQFATSSANLIDNNNNTFGVNFANGGAVGDLGWFGLRFGSAQDGVNAFEFDAQVFTDGGWFNTLNDEGNTLAPVIQYTTADISGIPTTGATVVSNTDNIWVTITSAIDNYPEVDNATTGAQANAAGVIDSRTYRWDFAPVDGVTGIRILGSQGGTATPKVGFLAAEEVRAFVVPEPTSMLLGAVGLGALAARRRRR